MARHAAQRAFALLWQVLILVAFVYSLYRAGKDAYKIRLYAIKTYGRVIHEVRLRDETEPIVTLSHRHADASTVASRARGD